MYAIAFVQWVRNFKSELSHILTSNLKSLPKIYHFGMHDENQISISHPSNLIVFCFLKVFDEFDDDLF